MGLHRSPHGELQKPVLLDVPLVGPGRDGMHEIEVLSRRRDVRAAECVVDEIVAALFGGQEEDVLRPRDLDAEERHPRVRIERLLIQAQPILAVSQG